MDHIELIPAGLSQNCISHQPKTDPPNPISEYAENLLRLTAQQLCRKRGFLPADQEEIEQDLRLKLFVALKKFNPARATESTFSARIVQNLAASMIRKRRALKRQAPAAPLNEGGSSNAALLRSLPARSDDFESRVQVAEVIASLPTVLLRRAAKLLMDFGIADTAEFLGINRCTFTTVIIPKLERAFSEAGFEPIFTEPGNMILSDCVSKCHEQVKEQIRSAPLPVSPSAGTPAPRKVQRLWHAGRSRAGAMD